MRPCGDAYGRSSEEVEIRPRASDPRAALACPRVLALQPLFSFHASRLVFHAARGVDMRGLDKQAAMRDAALRAAAARPGRGSIPLTRPGAGGACQMVTLFTRGSKLLRRPVAGWNARARPWPPYTAGSAPPWPLASSRVCGLPISVSFPRVVAWSAISCGLEYPVQQPGAPRIAAGVPWVAALSTRGCSLEHHGLQADTPGLQSGVPGLQPGVPGLQP